MAFRKTTWGNFSCSKRSPRSVAGSARRAREGMSPFRGGPWGWLRTGNVTGAANSLLFPGVKEMFGVLRGRGIRTGILTRNCLDAVTVIFPDVHSYCDAVVTRDDTPRVKPDPEHIRVVLARLNVEPSLCAMVGDHPMDIAVAKKVGAFAVGVLTGYSSADELKGAGAEMILEEVAEITNFLE